MKDFMEVIIGITHGLLAVHNMAIPLKSNIITPKLKEYLVELD